MARIVVYILTAMVLVSTGLAVAFGWVAFVSMQEAGNYREAAHEAQALARECRVQVERANAKLQQVERLFSYARGETPPSNSGMGGEN